MRDCVHRKSYKKEPPFSKLRVKETQSSQKRISLSLFLFRYDKSGSNTRDKESFFFGDKSIEQKNKLNYSLTSYPLDQYCEAYEFHVFV